MRKYFFTTIVLLFTCYIINGQISTEEKPISFTKSGIPALRTSERTNKIFRSLDMAKIEKEDLEDDAKGIPPRFGFPHEVNYNLNNSGEWTDLQDGGRIWRLNISCKDALSINLLYDKFWIPDGAKFFVYSIDQKHSIGAFTSANNNGDKNDIQGFATGLVYGDQITLEYYLPKEVKETGVISIAYVVHGYRYIVLPEAGGYGYSGGCQVNVNCSEGANWQNEKNAVALILVNGSRECTGSLVNTTANDNRPLLLTADHCLFGYDAVGNNSPNLTWWSFLWNYESPSCTSTSAPASKSTVGAKLVANNSSSDFALLDLSGQNSDPRNRMDVTTYYLGWDRTGNTGTGGVGIHHPYGDIKKIATYSQTPQHYQSVINRYWEVFWVKTTNGHSITEGGSSGSPLINNNRHIIGQLYGTLGGSCANPAAKNSLYGKFSESWIGNGNSDIRRRLNYWLDPLGTNPSTLNGRIMYRPTITLSGSTSVTVGQPGSSSGYTYYATLTNPSSAGTITNYEWSLSPTNSSSLYNYGNYVNIYFNPEDQYQLSCRVTNSYGATSSWAFLYVNASNRSPSPAYPNPVSSILNIDVGSTANAKAQNNSYDIHLYNAQGSIQRQIGNRGGGTVQIDVSNLSDGIYFLHIYDGTSNTPEIQQIIVKH